MVVIWNIDVIPKLASKYSGVVSQNYMTFVKVGNSLKILLNGKSQNRSLDQESERLWSKLTAEPVSLRTEIQIPETGKRAARQAKLEVRFCQVNLRTPYRFDNRDPLKVYAVYAQEVDVPEGETPVEWMLLTTEVVTDAQKAAEILRWYSYRWHVEEYHKILKSGCKVEQYRLAAEGMTSLLGFLSVIAVELLQLTYLHRTQPTALAIEILTPLQIKVLKATSKVKLPTEFTLGLGDRCYCAFRGLFRASSWSDWNPGSVARFV